jgi:hypothetical protein
MDAEQLIAHIDRLPTPQKWQVVNHILHTLQRERESVSHWGAALAEYAGILAADPIERPLPLPLEEREPLE